MKISDQTKRELALSLHSHNILQFGSFKFKSGIMAPFYVDLRILQSLPEVFHSVAVIYGQMLTDLPKDVLLAGIPEAGIPLATAVGYEAHRPLIQPRTKVKEYGRGKSIEGFWQAGDKVAVIDDLITKGDSKLESLEQLTANGLEVVGFYVLFDWEKGGRQLVESKGYRVEAAMTMNEVFTILAEEGKLTAAQKDKMISFMRQ